MRPVRAADTLRNLQR